MKIQFADDSGRTLTEGRMDTGESVEGAAPTTGAAEETQMGRLVGAIGSGMDEES